jgi:hypothetical protein
MVLALFLLHWCCCYCWSALLLLVFYVATAAILFFRTITTGTKYFLFNGLLSGLPALRHISFGASAASTGKPPILGVEYAPYFMKGV